ncbi:MAG TPA: carboxypeptidase-like regulatory domain-containing protein [Solirubrobacteraceae bacterium]|nr:carboxypeptidase-like regulatory domain-containing protein [Solirubrobacteraceae bacterium]
MLEQRSARGGWSFIAGSQIRRYRFALSWQPNAPGRAAVRVALVHHHDVLASVAGRVQVAVPATPLLPTAVAPTPVTPPTPVVHSELTLPRPERAIAPEHCAEPSPPNDVPAAEGWIIGGLYLSGGPAPGSFFCQSASYTVTATNEDGVVVATQQVNSGGQSFTLILPPGNYTLRSECASFPIPVSAEVETEANIVCQIP